MLDSFADESLGDPYPSWAIQILEELHSSEDALGFFTVMVVEDLDHDLNGLLFISYSLEDDAYDTFLTDFEYSFLEGVGIVVEDVFGDVDFTQPLTIH